MHVSFKIQDAITISSENCMRMCNISCIVFQRCDADSLESAVASHMKDIDLMWCSCINTFIFLFGPKTKIGNQETRAKAMTFHILPDSQA